MEAAIQGIRDKRKIISLADNARGIIHIISTNDQPDIQTDIDSTATKRDLFISTRRRIVSQCDPPRSNVVNAIEVLGSRSVRYGVDEEQILEEIAKSRKGQFLDLSLQAGGTNDEGGQDVRFDDEEGEEGDLIQSSSLRVPLSRIRHRRISGGEERRLPLRRGKRKKQKLSDRSMFQSALQQWNQLVECLKNDAVLQTSSTHIKVVHTLHGKREFGFMSAHVSSGAGLRLETAHREMTSKPLVAILWQTMSQPQRAVCVTCSLSGTMANGRDRANQSGEAVGGLNLACTCDILLPVSRIRSGVRCNHVEACIRDKAFTRRVLHVLQEKDERYFGTALRAEGAFPAAELHRHLPNQVAKSTRKWLKEWSFWIVLDVRREIFVPVLKVKKKGFQCQLCRGSYQRRGRCSHETSCTVKRNEWSEYLQERDEEDAEEDLLDFESSESSSSDEEAHTDRMKKKESATVELEKYMKNNRVRQLLMCDGDKHNTIILSNTLERMGENKTPLLKDGSPCAKCGGKKQDALRVSLRKVRLFTLSHGAPLIFVEDWMCGTCKEIVYFSGNELGVFPARKLSLYSVELMYVWVQIVCYQGQSFRNAYHDTRITRSSPGTMAMFKHKDSSDTTDMTHWEGEYKHSRRRANEAFRAFLRKLDVSGDTITRCLFSCHECEVDITKSDREELGLLDDACAQGMKRLKAIVIDGTSAGILASLPDYDRKPVKIPVPKRRREKQRLIHLMENRKTIKEACNLGRAELRRIVNRRRRFRPTETNMVSFSLSDDVTAKSSKKIGAGRGRAKKCKGMGKGHIDILRFYLDDSSCFCPTSTGQLVHAPDCAKKREEFAQWEEPDSVCTLLRTCLELECVENLGDEQRDETDGLDHAVIALPDREELGGSREGEEDNNGLRVLQHQSNTPRMEKTWKAKVLVPNLRNSAQLVESILDLIEFLLTEHVGTPYMVQGATPSPHGENGEMGISAREIGGIFSAPGVLNTSSLILARYSFHAHEKVASCMLKFSNCNHQGTIHRNRPSDKSLWPCETCVSDLEAAFVQVCSTNPALTRFCKELLLEGRGMPDTSRNISRSVACCLRDHIRRATLYFRYFDEHASAQSKDYWQKYGSVLLNGIPETLNDAEETGVSFPGRPRYRPGIVFEGSETHNCNKEYLSSEFHSPGLLTVQCSCNNPKLIGFVVMERAESTALALSAILSHFQVPPRVAYYDNACNLFTSTLLRCPWLLNLCRMTVDRFHYKSHKCCSFFDPDSYHALDTQRSTTAESINARIKRAMYHMRYLGSRNLIPFLQIRFALLNLAALYQQRYEVADMEDENLTEFLCELVSCDCGCCQIIRSPNDDEEETEEEMGETGETERMNMKGAAVAHCAAGCGATIGAEEGEIEGGVEQRDTEGAEEGEIEGVEQRDMHGVEQRDMEGAEEREKEGTEKRDIEGNNGHVERERQEGCEDRTGRGSGQGGEHGQQGDPGTGNKNDGNVGSISYIVVGLRGRILELPS